MCTCIMRLLCCSLGRGKKMHSFSKIMTVDFQPSTASQETLERREQNEGMSRVEHHPARPNINGGSWSSLTPQALRQHFNSRTKVNHLEPDFDSQISIPTSGRADYQEATTADFKQGRQRTATAESQDTYLLAKIDL